MITLTKIKRFWCLNDIIAFFTDVRPVFWQFLAVEHVKFWQSWVVWRENPMKERTKIKKIQFLNKNQTKRVQIIKFYQCLVFLYSFLTVERIKWYMFEFLDQKPQFFWLQTCEIGVIESFIHFWYSSRVHICVTC